jgi:DNA-binding transcriptional LysR family regulator
MGAAMFDLELLRSFVSVVDAGGFTRAGERVHRTQSTVSQQIKRLEEDVGQPLLVRKGKDVTPTEAGERLLSYARRLLTLAEEARDVVTRPTYQGAIRLGIPEDFAAYRLAKLLGAFSRSHPSLRLDVRADQSMNLQRDLDRGELDLALLKRTAGEKGAIAAWPERVHWVTSKTHPRDTCAADWISCRLSVPGRRNPCAGKRGPLLAYGVYLLEPIRHPGRGRRRHGTEHPVGDGDPGRPPRPDGKGRLCADRQDGSRPARLARRQPRHAAPCGQARGVLRQRAGEGGVASLGNFAASCGANAGEFFSAVIPGRPKDKPGIHFSTCACGPMGSTARASRAPE